MKSLLLANIAVKMKKMTRFCAQKPLFAFYVILSLLILLTMIYYLVFSNMLWDETYQSSLGPKRLFKQERCEEVFSILAEREKEFNEDTVKQYPDLFLDLTNK